MTKTSSSCEGIPGMNNDEIEPVRSAATAIAGAIINSFVVTHSIIITVIVAVSVLAVALSRVSEFATGLETAQGPGKVMKLGCDPRCHNCRDVPGGTMEALTLTVVCHEGTPARSCHLPP